MSSVPSPHDKAVSSNFTLETHAPRSSESRNVRRQAAQQQLKITFRILCNDHVNGHPIRGASDAQRLNQALLGIGKGRFYIESCTIMLSRAVWDPHYTSFNSISDPLISLHRLSHLTAIRMI